MTSYLERTAFDVRKVLNISASGLCVSKTQFSAKRVFQGALYENPNEFVGQAFTPKRFPHHQIL
jgi:hypothetical protein